MRIAHGSEPVFGRTPLAPQLMPSKKSELLGLWARTRGQDLGWGRGRLLRDRLAPHIEVEVEVCLRYSKPIQEIGRPHVGGELSRHAGATTETNARAERGEWTGISSARANAWHSFIPSFTATSLSLLQALLQQVPAAEGDGAPRAGAAGQATGLGA